MTGSAPARRSRLARLAVASCAALLCAAFAVLGTWQLQRLHWKTALIAQVGQRVGAAPAAAPSPEAWARLGKDQDEYRHLRLDGRFLDTLATPVQASTALGSGYWLLAPFCSADGAIVMVNRGFVRKAPVKAAATSREYQRFAACRRSRPTSSTRTRNRAPRRWTPRSAA
jgi:surfeit locus 1 family protein